jgi:hypothetical protein
MLFQVITQYMREDAGCNGDLPPLLTRAVHVSRHETSDTIQDLTAAEVVDVSASTGPSPYLAHSRFGRKNLGRVFRFVNDQIWGFGDQSTGARLGKQEIGEIYRDSLAAPGYCEATKR